MMGKYLTENRKKLLPWVEDFSDPQDELRFSKDIKGMNWMQFYWCSPYAYKLMHFGQPALAVLVNVCFATYFFMVGWGIMSLALSVIVLYSSKQLYERIKNRDDLANFTYYDLYLRDFLVTEVESVKETFKKGYKEKVVQSKDEERN